MRWKRKKGKEGREKGRERGREKEREGRGNREEEENKEVGR